MLKTETEIAIETRVAEIERQLLAKTKPLNTTTVEPKPPIDRELLWVNRTAAEAEAAGVGHTVLTKDGYFVPRLRR